MTPCLIGSLHFPHTNKNNLIGVNNAEFLIMQGERL